MSQTNGRLTLESLARARGLDPALLRRLGWTERADGIAIPWQRSDGQTAWHIRLTIEREDGRRRWVWSGFDRASLLPYLGQYLPAWRAKGHTAVVITESETDAVALASVGLAAVATAGADNWQGRWWALLRGFDQVIVWLEDGGSLPLLQAVLESRPADGPTVYVAHNIGGPKDPGRILAASNGDGRAILHRRIEAAVPVEQTADLLSTVIGRLRVEKRPNGSYSARCPFHADRHPSLSIFKGDDGRWAFRCHSGRCGVGGPLGLLGAALGLAAAPAAPNSILPTKGDSWAETNFLTADALLAEPEAQTVWVLDGYLPQSGVVLLSGRAKAGKTTWLVHLLRALLAGEPFMGRSPRLEGRVALLSEEPPSLVARRLRSLGLSGDRLLLTFRCRTRTALGPLVEEALRLGARLIVIDTLGAWGGIADENAATEVEAALRPVVSAVQAAGACLLILHHLRKSDGPEGTAHRGSGHLVALADIALELRRPEGQGPETRRVLRALSRYEETPPELVLDLTPEGYVALGTPAEAQHQQVRQALLDHLPGPDEVPVPLESASETDSVLARLRAVGLTAPRTTVQRALEELTAEGLVERHGRGVRGDPHRYRLAPPNSFLPNSHLYMGRNELQRVPAGAPTGAGESPEPPPDAHAVAAPPAWSVGGSGSKGCNAGRSAPPTENLTDCGHRETVRWPGDSCNGPPGPDRPCRVCGGRRFWWRPAGSGGDWVCTQCHPAPGP